MKSALKALFVFILIGVSIFFGFTYYKTFLKEEVQAESGDKIDNIQTELPGSGGDLGNGNTSDNTQTTKPDPPIPQVFRSVLPRSATKSTDGNINNVGGYGVEELKEYFKIGNSYIVVLSTTSDNCDIKEQGSGLCIATFDNLATLNQTVSLKSESREKYLCSSIYDNGVLIVTTDGKSTNIWGYSIDGVANKLTLPTSSDCAISYYTTVGTVVACWGGGKIHIYCISANLSVIYNTEFDALGTTQPKALFRSGTFVLFANGENFAKLFTFDFNGVGSNITLSIIRDVIPTHEGYLIASYSGGKIYLNRYSYDVNALGTTELCTGFDAKLGVSQNGYYAIVYGANEQTISYFMCRHFDVVSTNKSDYLGFTSVEDVVCDNGKIYFRCVNRENCYLYEYDTNNHTAKSLLTLNNCYGLKFWIDSSQITLFYTSPNTIGIHSTCWGSSDVWMQTKPRS